MSDWLARLYFQLMRRRIVARVKANPIAAWPLARRVFATTDRVYRGPVGYAATLTLPAEVMDCLLDWRDRGAVENCLVAGLRDPHPLVVGYCLDGLAAIASPRLLTLQPELLNRYENIRTQCGCFSFEQSLGEFASSQVSRYQERLIAGEA